MSDEAQPQADRLEKVHYPPLSRITTGRRQEELTQRQNATVERFERWRGKMHTTLRLPNVTPGKAKRVEKLINCRNSLLVDADARAIDIARNGRFEDATALAHRIRLLVESCDAEKDKFLTVWNERLG
jgi:hypothetical protein